MSGLTNGTAYTFTVKATNGEAPGLASTASAAATPATVPGASTGACRQRSNGNQQSVVTWTAPASNGGAAITDYTVTSSPGGFPATPAPPAARWPGLTDGTPYTFTVTATNAAGTGPRPRRPPRRPGHRARRPDHRHRHAVAGIAFGTTPTPPSPGPTRLATAARPSPVTR